MVIKIINKKIKNNNSKETKNKIKNKIKNKTKNKTSLKIFSFKRYTRYIKLILNIQIVTTVIIISIISNTIIIFQNQKYKNLYKESQQLDNIIGIVESNSIESEYYYTYIVRIISVNNSEKYKNTKLYVKINKNRSGASKMEYGDEISFSGGYIKPDVVRNTKGFDYLKYLKTLKIYGTIKTSNIKIIENNDTNIITNIYKQINNLSTYLKEKVNTIFNKQTAQILNGLILGDTSQIEEEIKDNFKSANISHILAISGMHISYLIILLENILNRIIGKRKTRYIIIIFLIIYMTITGFSPSVTRAGSIGILIMLSKLIYRKNDFLNSISFSLVIQLIYNPYLILNQGLQFSYTATIGIVYLCPVILNILNIWTNKICEKQKYSKNKYLKMKKEGYILTKIKEMLSVTLSAQIAILPIMILNYNIFNTYFLITNLLVAIIIGPIIMCSFIVILISIILADIAVYLAYIVELGIQILLYISNIGNLPFSNIYCKTPSIISIIVYYIILIILKILHDTYLMKKISITKTRIKNYISVIKYRFIQNKQKHIKILTSIIIILILINLIPKKFQINFIDIGQGDGTFIVTPQNKTILIDGGGSSFFKVGKNTLIPYILDKGYTHIDYIFISHFDTDHVGAILELIKELKVGNIFISEQIETSENYEIFKEITSMKNINVQILKQGNRLDIEKDIYIDIIWPQEEQIEENPLNNNSLVMKMYYKDFSILFTGDIEKIAEEKLIKSLKNTEILESTVLKVPHHGSKTSTTKEFLECINPKIALIGVGKNNLFGHPSNDVIKRLEECNVQIFRTDFHRRNKFNSR